MTTPGLLVAATHSGAGKTTATAVLLRALVDRGLAVQAFKVGPDFIDPAYHAEVTGRPSINLDVWMMGEDGVRAAHRRWCRGADVAVVESMGALHDGADGTGEGSAAHVARLLGLPVVVVLDVWGMTRTAGALLAGLRDFDPAVDVAGCLLNRVGSERHAALVVGALADDLRPLVLGALPHRADLEVPERHLGLLTVDENPRPAADRARALRAAGAGLDVEAALRVAARATGPGPDEEPDEEPDPEPVARLAVARDAAFCFQYEENLRALRRAGFALVPFRPTADAHLPPGTDAVWLGGGYPESAAGALAANRALADELRGRVADGLPVHAECGGLLYLARSLAGFDGRRHRMAGVLPLDVALDPGHLAIRYVEARTRAATPLGPAGTVVRGQEFHQSRVVGGDVEPSLYDVTSSDGRRGRDGYAAGSVTAGYVHLHLGSNPGVARHLVAAAVAARG